MRCGADERLAKCRRLYRLEQDSAFLWIVPYMRVFYFDTFKNMLDFFFFFYQQQQFHVANKAFKAESWPFIIFCTMHSMQLMIIFFIIYRTNNVFFFTYNQGKLTFLCHRTFNHFHFMQGAPPNPLGTRE